MATTEQEEIYNEIIKYYSLSEELISKLEIAQQQLNEDDLVVAENMLHCLEENTEKLANTYLEYIRSINAQEAIKPVRESISSISAEIEKCRGHFLNMMMA